MAINSLFPGFVVLYYTTNGHIHKMTVPAQPYAGIGGAWFLSEKASSVGRAWVLSFTDFVNVFRPCVITTGTLNFAELWTMDTPTSDPIFRESTDISLAGTRAGTPLAYSQEVITFRSANGGLYRFVNLESATSVNVVTNPPFAAPFAALRTYLIGNTSCVSARDGGFLIAALRMVSKTNDKLREKFLLDA